MTAQVIDCAHGRAGLPCRLATPKLHPGSHLTENRDAPAKCD
jgi:hypothetical protein